MNKKGGQYIFNSLISGNNITLGNGANIKLGSKLQSDESTTYGHFDNTGLTVNKNVVIDSINQHIDNNTLTTLTINNNANIAIDYNFAANTADNYSAQEVTKTNTLQINKIALFNDDGSSQYKNRRRTV